MCGQGWAKSTTLHYQLFSDCEPILTPSISRGLWDLLFILKRCDPVTLAESYALGKGAILLATQKADWLSGLGLQFKKNQRSLI